MGITVSGRFLGMMKCFGKRKLLWISENYTLPIRTKERLVHGIRKSSQGDAVLTSASPFINHLDFLLVVYTL